MQVADGLVALRRRFMPGVDEARALLQRVVAKGVKTESWPDRHVESIARSRRVSIDSQPATDSRARHRENSWN